MAEEGRLCLGQILHVYRVYVVRGTPGEEALKEMTLAARSMGSVRLGAVFLFWVQDLNDSFWVNLPESSDFYFFTRCIYVGVCIERKKFCA